MRTKGVFLVEGPMIENDISLWEHTAPTSFELTVLSTNQVLVIWNIWEAEDGKVRGCSMGAAMLISESEKRRRYSCNDGYPDEDFDDLVFTLECLD